MECSGYGLYQIIATTWFWTQPGGGPTLQGPELGQTLHARHSIISRAPPALGDGHPAQGYPTELGVPAVDSID